MLITNADTEVFDRDAAFPLKPQPVVRKSNAQTRQINVLQQSWAEVPMDLDPSMDDPIRDRVVVIHAAC
jgi:hypothetical protein